MSGDVGSWFPVPDETELPENLRKLFAKAREGVTAFAEKRPPDFAPYRARVSV